MDDMTRSAELPLISDYTRFARRHRTPIAVAMVIGVLVGLMLALLQPSTFSATASVALTPVPVYVAPSVSDLAPPPVTIDTDAQLVRSSPVLAAVGRALGVDDARSEEHITVTASPNTNILHVTVTAADAREAARAADAAALALVDVRRTALGALTHDQIRQLRFMMIAQEGMLAREQARRLVIPVRDELFGNLIELRTRLSELRTARRVPAEVIGPAADSGQADYANTEVPLTSGAVLGLVVGCLIGAARDRSRRTSVVLKENEHAC
jgi:hypothetical protein